MEIRWKQNDRRTENAILTLLLTLIYDNYKRRISRFIYILSFWVLCFPSFFVSLRANNWYKNRLVDHTIRKAIKIIDEGLINRSCIDETLFSFIFSIKRWCWLVVSYHATNHVSKILIAKRSKRKKCQQNIQRGSALKNWIKYNSFKSATIILNIEWNENFSRYF